MKSNIPLTAGFGNKVFVNGRWVRREETKRPPAWIRLEELEKQINQNFLAAAEALREIKENKLYLHVADTWEQYCRERLGRGIEAVRLQIKALEIAEKSHNVGVQSIKDVRKQARIPVRKRVLNPTPMPSPIIEKDNGDLLSEIMDRIQAHADNEDFLNALKEWLDESGI